ncbi:hypothetical protein LCGC14_2486470 [marine sediment metagenome]|uniref:Uncharacterized protein n=1 Tax=marine sediment metagenome TaxID=412755 RepID=A0A0F9B5Z6_9ZZZZ
MPTLGGVLDIIAGAQEQLEAEAAGIAAAAVPVDVEKHLSILVRSYQGVLCGED